MATTEQEQLTFHGLEVVEQAVKLTGNVLLPADVIDQLALGDTLQLYVKVQASGVSGKAQRDEWGDDKAHVAWTLTVTESSTETPFTVRIGPPDSRDS